MRMNLLTCRKSEWDSVHASANGRLIALGDWQTDQTLGDFLRGGRYNTKESRDIVLSCGVEARVLVSDTDTMVLWEMAGALFMVGLTSPDALLMFLKEYCVKIGQ